MNSTTEQCPPAGDNLFGPQVEPCLRSFDFTLQFENILLSAAPSALFLLIALARIYHLRDAQKRVVGGRTFRIVKLLAIALFGILQLALLILWSLDPAERTPATVAAATLSLVNTVAFCALSYTEHGRNLRPSAVLGAYLFFSLLFDIVRVRTLWLIGEDANVARLFTTSAVLKAIILIFEAQEKREYLNEDDQKRGPEELSSIFSQGVFYWLNNLILNGYRKVLSIDDLYPLDEGLSAEHLRHKFTHVWESSAKSSKHRLLFQTTNALKWEFFAPVIYRIAMIGFTFCQPFLLNRFIRFLQEKKNPESINIGYGLIAAYGLAFLGLAISKGLYYHRSYRYVAMLRGTLVTAIYQKTTEISITALDNSAAVTLMSTDVERIVMGFKQVHEFWANFIQVGLATWLLQRELGVACVAPIGIAILAAAAALGASGPAAKRQGIWMKALQKRVGITSTMLSSMKGVKMAGLTDKLASIIQTLRLDEITSASRFRWVVFYSVVIAFAPLHISPVVTFATFTGTSNGSLNTATMFTSISLLGLLSSPLSMVFQSIPNFMAAINCFQRIQKYLETETKSDHRFKMQELLHDVSATSEDDRSINIGDEIELIGLTSSTRTAHPVPQEQEVIGVRNGSFGWKPDEEPILRDINLSIKNSQLTMIIGPVASGKSTLLKALLGETTSTQGFVYVSSKEVAFCDQSPWLINGSVQKNILGFATFDGPWYNAVLHASGLEEDLASFPMGDQTQIGSKGITLSGGQKQRVAIARAVYSKKGIVIMDDVFSGMDATTEDLVFHRLLGPDGLLRRSNSTVILATHAVNLLPLADYIVALGSDGGILEQGAFDHLNTIDGYVRSFSVQQGKRKSEIEESPGKRTLEPLSASPLMDAMDEKKRQLGDMAVYMYYFKSIGILPTLLFFAYSVIFSFFSTFPTVWLKWWSDSETKHPNQNTAKYMGVYSVLEISTLAVLALLCWHTFMQINPKSGRQLHWITLRTVASAPMSLFSMVDTGVLVNRFSQDMELIDGELPMAGLNFSVAIFICLGQAILIATATFYIALAYPFIAFVFYLVQKYYLRTSRQLRFMDLEAKSPLYTQFIESLSGLSTIRAFGWQQNERDLNLLLLDTSQRPFYLLLMIQRWLSLVLDLVCVALALIVTGLAVKLRDVVSPGFTGVALINIIEFNLSLQGLVMWWTNLETSIGAVSRVRTFSEVTPTEALPQEITPPPQNWPLHGAIKLKNVSASYKTTDDDNLALNNVSLSILPGEKLGICGRSGSGKSSFILALFRMMEISSGSILIDDIDLSTLPRQQIRGRLNVISQDPYFIAGSIRLNLDPYEASSDELILSALHKVQLHTTITSLGGLDTELDVDSLSHGQRQLFCLARAMLRQSKIIVLDEATSSVDRKTDELMQRVIREEFAGCTVVAVAHRLETILDFDRILVLERGTVKECDTPAKLLAQGSAFKELYDIYSSSSKEAVEES